MIQGVFFDYDGVLTTDRTGSLSTAKFLARRTGIALDAWLSALRSANPALSRGQRSHADVWPELCARVGQAVPIELLADAFESTPPNHAMRALAVELRRCGLSVGIVTDNKQDRMQALRRTQRLDEVFDPIVVSADVGCTKSDPAIFRLALARMGVEAAHAVFIDNTQDNLVAPRALGLHAVHFDDQANDVQGLRELLRTRFRIALEALSGPSPRSA